MKPPLPDREPKALTIHQMRVFLKRVEAGSFSRTAIMVGVTQSALSRITAQMEAVLVTMREPNDALEAAGIRSVRAAGDEGVKLEQMVRITDEGCELVADFPFEDELLR